MQANDKSAYYYTKFLKFCNGKNDVIDIAQKIDLKAFELFGVVDALLKNGLIKQVF